MFSGVSTSAVAPHATGSRASNSAFREIRLDHLKVVHRRQHRALLRMPAPDQFQKIGAGLGVDRIERLVEHDHAGVLQQQAREQHALHLPAGQRADRTRLEAGEADRGDGAFDGITILGPMPPNRPLPRHRPIATMS